MFKARVFLVVVFLKIKTVLIDYKKICPLRIHKQLSTDFFMKIGMNVPIKYF